jgi:transcriptional regulator with XRE-family HTH domain
MSVISKRFADELAEKEMRHAYLSAQTRTKLINQIRAIRNERGWSQGQFAEILGKPQSNVSRLENREYGSFTLNTLFELASAFDVGLIVEFVPYENFLLHTRDLSTENLQVSRFSRRALDVLTRDSPMILQQAVSGAAAAAQNADTFSHQKPVMPSAPLLSMQNEMHRLAPAERIATDHAAPEILSNEPPRGLAEPFLFLSPAH